MNWQQFGIMQIEEAGNGEEALKLLDIFCPEIVLVDIRMPKMDGLAFIENAKKTHPETVYVIMTAYSDFSYAKTAIQLGVEAYLLKPINKTELEKLLSRLLHKMNEKKLSRMTGSVRVDELEHKGILRYPFVMALAFYSTEEEIGERIEVIVQSQMAQKEEHHENCFSYFLRNCSRSTCYVFLLNTEVNNRDTGRECGEAVINAMEGITVKAAVSEVFERSCFKEAVNQSLCFLKRKMFYDQEKLIFFSLGKLNTLDTGGQVRKELEQIYGMISRGEYEHVEEGLLEIIDNLIQKSSSVPLIEEGINEVLVLLSHLTKDTNSDIDFNILFHDFRSKDYLLIYDAAEELRASLRNLVKYLLGIMQQGKTTDIIARIKEYIEKNYGDSLNATELAQKYGLSVSYLSTLFKERTGVNLTAYMEGIRMEKAKNLLKNREWRVTEIAIHVGYSNSNYFSKVFKKYTGVTPREFREMERQR